MTAYRHQEETLNTQLAILLSRFGVKADAETIQASGRERPDVLFNWRGLRVVIEGKFSPITRRRGRWCWAMRGGGCNVASPTSPSSSFTPARSALGRRWTCGP